MGPTKPECIVIVTQHPWHGFFTTVAEAARSIRNGTRSLEGTEGHQATLTPFLEALHHTALPPPGGVVSFTLSPPGGGDTSLLGFSPIEDLMGEMPGVMDMLGAGEGKKALDFTFTRPDSFGFAAEADFGPLMHCIGTQGLLSLMEALLGEGLLSHFNAIFTSR